MFPEIDPIYVICEAKRQEWLRYAAQQRLAAAAQAGAPARRTTLADGWRAALCRFSGLLPLLLSGKRAQASPPLASNQAQAAPHAL